MKAGIVILVLAYGMSQFYRAFLAVLTPSLSADIGATADDLATASGVWFLVFAAMQIPVGAMLDRIGPKTTVVAIFALGGAGGALAFALAQTPLHVILAMGLIGVGCSPVLMASYYIFAKVYSPAVFATLAGATIGLGSLGNLAGSAPMAWSVATFGWRETMLGLAALSFAIAALMWVLVKDPAREVTAHKGSVLDLLRMPALWPVFAIIFVSYAPSAGLRGLWVGPYGAQVHGLDAAGIGQMTLVMALAMIAGSFIYGPLDRIFGTRKGVVLAGSVIALAALTALWLVPATGIFSATILLAVVGLAGASFPLIIAHGKAFLPPHLTGRGVTLMNLFGIGGVGVMQLVTGRLFAASEAGGATPPESFSLLFGVFALLLLAGILAYTRATDRTD